MSDITKARRALAEARTIANLPGGMVPPVPQIQFDQPASAASKLQAQVIYLTSALENLANAIESIEKRTTR